MKSTSTTPPSPLLPSTCRLGAALLFAVLAIFGMSGCGSSASTGDKGYVEGNGVITNLAPAKRVQAGPISGMTLQGKRLVVPRRGRVVVVNVWADWCAPCRAEAPSLVQAARRLLPKGVEFVGLAVRSSAANAAAFERGYHVPYPSILDQDGQNLLSLRGALSPNAIPSTIVLDTRGRIAASVLGQVPSATTLVDMVHDVQAGT